MQFTAADSSTFKSMQDPNQADTIVQVAQQTHVGQALGFTITGTGTISEQPAQAAPGGMGGGGQGAPAGQEQTQAAPDNRPGGGLGAPIDAPDPLERYRWWIIGGFVLLLAIGGWIVTKRQGAVSLASGPTVSGPTASGSSAFGSTAAQPGALGSKPSPTRASGPLAAPITGPGATAISGASAASVASSTSPARPITPAPASAPPANAASSANPPATQPAASPATAGGSKSAMLLEALKEELFQLEVELKQGKITKDEYEKHKAALDQTLDRALKRMS
jgi:hypothetical protein